MKDTILIVEDQYTLAELIAERLQKENFEVIIVSNGQDAIDKIFSTEISLIVLDIILPKINGLEVLKKVRESKINTPILVLTTRDGSENIIQGLDHGADDYVSKPFRTEELVARIKSLLRRATRGTSEKTKYKDIEIDFENKAIYKEGKEIHLSQTQFQIFTFLLRNPGLRISREKLINNIWSGRTEPSVGAVDVHITEIRNLLDKQDRQKYIKTAHGIGYYIDLED